MPLIETPLVRAGFTWKKEKDLLYSVGMCHGTAGMETMDLTFV